MFGRKRRAKHKAIREAYSNLTSEDFRTKTLSELEDMCGIPEDPPDPVEKAFRKEMEKTRNKFDKVAKRIGESDV